MYPPSHWGPGLEPSLYSQHTLLAHGGVRGHVTVMEQHKHCSACLTNAAYYAVIHSLRGPMQWATSPTACWPNMARACVHYYNTTFDSPPHLRTSVLCYLTFMSS